MTGEGFWDHQVFKYIVDQVHRIHLCQFPKLESPQNVFSELQFSQFKYELLRIEFARICHQS